MEQFLENIKEWLFTFSLPTGNASFWEIISAIGSLLVPILLTIWGFCSEHRKERREEKRIAEREYRESEHIKRDKEEIKRKEEKEKEEQQQKEILNILLQYYKEIILPYKIIIYEREVSIALIKTLIHKYFELDMRSLPPYKLRTKTFLEKMEEIRIYFDTNKNNDDIQENTITLLLYLIDWTEPMLMNQDVFEKHSQFTTDLIGVFGIKK